MSLVGSLEDLGLGDILQIVSLSRKSGVLLLRSESGEGRIVLRDGLVRAAFVKGEPEDLRGLLVGGGFVSAEDFEGASETAQRRDLPLEEAVSQRTGLSGERLDSLRREHVERAVLCMFTWRCGEFSFEVRGEIDESDTQLLLPNGINAQYLAMEATRLGDEGRAAEADEGELLPGSGEGPVFGIRPTDTISCGDEDSARPDGVPQLAQGREAVALAAARATGESPDDDGSEFSDGGGGEGEARSASGLRGDATDGPGVDLDGEPEGLPCLVAIDSDLAVLEWLKSTLAEHFSRVHIFQHTDGGVARIRQYLGRAEVPVVLISEDAPADPLTGGSDVSEIVRRLRTQAPRMSILVMRAQNGEGRGDFTEADAVLRRPSSQLLADRRRRGELEEMAEAMREAVRTSRSRGPSAPVPIPDRPAAAGCGESGEGADFDTLHRLKRISSRLQDPATQGEVLSLVLEFASESFSRVVIFMVRDELAVGIAQSGLAGADGSDGPDPGEIRVPTDDSQWFRAVIEGRSALRAPPAGEVDCRLVEQLGGSPPKWAYVAPIVSGNRVAAILYADDFPGDRTPGDTTALEIALHEAGLALDRAFLERALSEARGGS
jgi:hypothetical protein